MSVPGPGRPMLRCGRTDQPVMHLLEVDHTITEPSWHVGGREHTTLCATTVDEATSVPDFDPCPGCPDCTRYCRRCVQMAVRFCEQPEQPTEVHVGQLRVPARLLARCG